MHSPPIESPVRFAHRTSGVTRPLAAALALAAGVLGTLFLPSVSHAQSCYCPNGMDSQGNPVTGTSCGQPVCGADFQWYSCEESGWSAQGISCQGEEPPPSCYCPNGVDFMGNPVTATTCGEQVCGADFQYYSCGETGWSAQGTTCPEEGPVAGVQLPTLAPLDSARVTATLGISPTAWGISAEALENQIALSNVRVRVGRAMNTLQTLPPTAPPEQQSAAATALYLASMEMADVEMAQYAFSAEQRERARLPVLITRISQLEQQYASHPGYAVQLARQAYYNGGMYWAASGAEQISLAMIDLIGVPHGPIHPDGNGGYIAETRAPNGQRVDFGHLLCAVDFNAPWPRVGSGEPIFRNPLFYGDSGLPIPNIANHGGMVSLAGDLGTASNFMVDNETDGWTALMNEGHEDMRGDVDGLNVSFLLGYHWWPGMTPVASTLSSYYFGWTDDTYTNRADIFIRTSPYVLDGRIAGLGFTTTDALLTDVGSVGIVFALMGHDWRGALGSPFVVGAFQEWLTRELAGTNPTTE